MRCLLATVCILLLCSCSSSEELVVATEKGPAPKLPRQKQLFLVIDDAGLELSETQQYLDIPLGMTIAVLPHLKQTRAVCEAIVRDPGKEIILHQPMEAYNPEENPGPGAILNRMSPLQATGILDRNLDSVRGAVGMNNHMGSRVTENMELMRAILHYCKTNDLLFLDSKTAYNSQVSRMAAQEHMHMEERDVFLDITHDRETIRHRWADAVEKARQNGYAIVIGHAWSAETAAAIRDSYETLQNQGYTFHKLSELYE